MRSWWNKHIANPIKKHGYAGPGAQAMQLLKREMLDKCLLRRTKVRHYDTEQSVYHIHNTISTEDILLRVS